MHRHSHGSQVANTHHAADYISSEVVKDQNLPDGVAICVEDWRNWSKETVGMSLIGFAGLDGFVEIEDFLEGRSNDVSTKLCKYISMQNTYLAIS